MIRMDFGSQILWIVFGFIFFGWLIFLSWWLYRTLESIKVITGANGKKTFVLAIEGILKEIDSQNKEAVRINKAIEQVNKENLRNLQKVGLVRFNPFIGTGGNQSFSLALLDSNNNGVVISSLHSRETTRIYVKGVRAGLAENIELSDEEKQAVKEARKTK